MSAAYFSVRATPFSIFRLDRKVLHSKSSNHFFVRFELADEFKGLNAVAVFSREDLPEAQIHVPLENNEAKIPNSLYQASGVLIVSLWSGGVYTLGNVEIMIDKSDILELNPGEPEMDNIFVQSPSEGQIPFIRESEGEGESGGAENYEPEYYARGQWNKFRTGANGSNTAGAILAYFTHPTEFPNVGETQTLYIVTAAGEESIYRWDSADIKYYLVSNNYENLKIISGGNAHG